MASRLAFQTQLASIMEVLANAAVAEICKLVDDDYAVVSLQMSQCQRENKALKRKLHLMELKMARCFAERRLRDSSASIGRARVHVGGNDRFRSSSTTSGVVFEGQMDMGSWPGRAAPGAASTEPTTCDLQQDTSTDVELVEAELVKQEKMEETEEEVQEEVQLIRADGQLERGPGCSQVQRSSRPQQEVQADYHHSECPDPVSASTRGVEVSGSSPLLKAQLRALAHGPHASLLPPTTPLEPLHTFSHVTNGGALQAEFCGEVLEDAGTVASRPSCSYSGTSAFPSPCGTNGGANGWGRRRSAEGLDPGPPRPSGPQEKAFRQERLFVCNFCGKAFNRPKKLEIHQRIHTGEKPFSCPTCGKMFSEAGNLKKHQRVHSGDTYSCFMCGKGFSWIRNLKAHQRKSHPEVPLDQEN